MDFQFSDKKFQCIAPFADMVNHSLDVQVCHVYDPISGRLQIMAGKDYAPGEQVAYSSTHFFSFVYKS